jgi:hypothetical protein
MKCSLRLRLWGAPLALLLLAGAGARADQIDVPWSYSWAPGSATVLSDSGAGGVSFTGEKGVSAQNNSNIVASELRVFSAASPDKPEKFDSSGAYALALTLTDFSDPKHPEGVSTDLTFHGKLSGTFSKANATIDNTFGADARQHVTLGVDDYTVTLQYYTPPGPPDALRPGTLGALVEVTGGVQTAHAPEPSAMLLSCLGLSFLGAASWRKRRRAARVAVA